MRLEQIQYFQKLAQTGSITAASQQLYISQQALSIAIKKLEEELHTDLFIRTSRGVQLTTDGEYFLSESTKITDTLEQIHLHFLAQNNSNVVLKIGAIPVISRYIMPKSISYFYKNLPNVKLDIESMSSSEILAALYADEIDLGFISESSLNPYDACIEKCNLQFTPLFHLPFSIAMHRNHPLNPRRVLSFEELAPYPALVLNMGNLENYLPYRILQHYHVESIITVDNEILFNQMLEDGLGYALYTQIPSAGTVRSDSPIVFHPLKENLFSTIGYVHRQTNDNKSPYIKLFCEHL